MFLRAAQALSLLLAVALTTACDSLPSSGPSRRAIDESGQEASTSIQLVNVDASVTQQLAAQRTQRLFSEALPPAIEPGRTVGPGDSLEITIWEAPPAMLFSAGTAEASSTSGSSLRTTLPEQMVDREGTVTVPFIGKVAVTGRTLTEIEAEVVRRLASKAHKPEAMIRRIQNRSSTVTVVGEVANSVNVALTPGGERLLDALAAAGGVRQPVSKMTIQITRGQAYAALPLDTVIRDPRQNVPLQAGDVVTAMFQPLSFTALGATGKNEEISFEAQGISLAQALARAGGLVDTRSDSSGVFIFRFEREETMKWPRQPVTMTASGTVPVVYHIDLKNPGSFFLMQNFAINNGDVVFVSNAPTTELQKFLNLVFSVAYPVLTTIQVTR